MEKLLEEYRYGYQLLRRSFEGLSEEEEYLIDSCNASPYT
jgi:hypothetical protein